MIESIEYIKKLTVKPKLLVHVCCAPCLLGMIERVLPYFDITLYFYNDNIDTLEEYDKRLKEVEKVAGLFSLNLIKEEYNFKNFRNLILGLELEPEKGKRCTECYKIRLEKTSKLTESFDYFMTTLTVSSYKNTKVINELGKAISKKYIVTDFKKGSGALISSRNTEKYNIYRQSYCGCPYSKR